MWGTVEVFAQLYPWKPTPADISFANTFLGAGGVFSKLIPCPTCVEHWNAFSRKSPPLTQNKESLIRWVLDAHNDVNMRAEKPLWTYDNVNCSYRGPSWKEQFKEELSTHPKRIRSANSEQSSSFKLTIVGSGIVCILLIFTTFLYINQTKRKKMIWSSK